MTSDHGPMCGEDHLQAIMAEAADDTERGVQAVDEALAAYPDDPRLAFLRGSLLIGLKRFVEAHAALSRAVALAPDFAIARFQLGFFELTSGEADSAIASWAPLKRALPAEHYLAHFVGGLEALIADRNVDCVASLRRGIAANDENPPLNRDMELIVGQCEELAAKQEDTSAEDTSGHFSATSFLLGARRH